MIGTNRNKLLGFDEYYFMEPTSYIVRKSNCTGGGFDCGYEKNLTYIPMNYLKSLGYNSNEWSDNIPDNKELLNEAKVIYIHPDCTIPKSFASKKYKKSLNPWLADAVIIPNLKGALINKENDRALFINEEKKLVALMHSVWSIKELPPLVPGKTIREIANSDMNYYHTIDTDTRNNCYSWYGHVVDLINAKYENTMAYCYLLKNQGFLEDIIIGALPKDKIVYEDTLLNSLNDDSNKLTYDSLYSIYEMLGSTDVGTVSTAMKALTAMDYMNYPNSVKFVLGRTNDHWHYNKTRNSTAFKYLYVTLLGRHRRHVYYSREISRDDWEIFKKLHETLDITHKLPNYPFTCIDDDLKIQAIFSD